VILDCNLSWIPHVSDKGQKANTAFWMCSFGRSWSLSSRAILWIYEAVIRLMMSHGCIVWWPMLGIGIGIGSARKELCDQRQVCICTTGAMELLLAIPPIHAVIQARAFATADRLV